MIDRLRLDAENGMSAFEALRTVRIACGTLKQLHPNLQLNAEAAEALEVLEAVVRESDI